MTDLLRSYSYSTYVATCTYTRVNPGDVLDCSLNVDIRIAEEEPVEEPEDDPSSNHNSFLYT